MINEFKTYHPLVNLIYFAFIVGFSCVFMHPVFLGISLCGAFSYSVILKGKKAIKTNILYMLPTALFMAVLNPVFNHEGVTIISYLPDGNPLTLESMVYGICAAVMIISLICWFLCLNEVITSDKIVYLFGRILPSLALMLSMTLRFVPRFIQQFKNVAEAQEGISNDGSKNTICKRIKNTVRVISIVITWALENGVDTADSMKARGYGTKRRSSFSVFHFDGRDGITLALILCLGIYIILGRVFGGVDYTYFPSMNFSCRTPYSTSIFLAFALMVFIPTIIELLEKLKWNVIKSKT